jgi:hypothetical protein
VLGENVQGMLSVFTGFGIPLNTMSGVVQVKYQSPSVSITADAKSGKILKAELKYHLVIELPVPLISTPRVAADYSVIKKAY